MSDWQPVPGAAPQGPQPLAKLSTAVLVLTALVLVAQAVQVFVYRTFNPAGFSGQSDLSFDDLPALMMFIAVVATGAMLGWAQIIVGVIWMYRASANITAAGIRDRTWGPGWAVGAWFIPVANLVLGFLVIREIWRGSQPGITDADWKQVPLPAWIVVWWSFFTASYLISYGAAAYSMITTIADLARAPATAPVQPDVFLFSLASAFCYVVAGVFFLRFVMVVRDLQDNAVGGLPAMPPPALFGQP